MSVSKTELVAHLVLEQLGAGARRRVLRWALGRWPLPDRGRPTKPRPVTAASALHRWLLAKGVSGAELARRVGVSKQSINAMTRATKRPRPDVAEAIERETRGAVKASAWRVPG